MKNPGKAKCEVLKEIRKQIAAANDIEYSTTECKFQGECSGTCPKCEQELAYLTEEIRKRKDAGLTVDFEAFKRYREAMEASAEEPNTQKKHSALKAAVVAAAAAFGVTALSSCNLFQKNGDMQRTQLEGEVEKIADSISVDNQVMGEVPENTTDSSTCKVPAAKDSVIIEELAGDVPAIIPVEEDK